MLNSEHEILNAHKYINISRNSFFLGSDKPRMLFFPLINVKMPTIVGILTNMSRIINVKMPTIVGILTNMSRKKYAQLSLA